MIMLALLLFFVSGASALIYEVLWTRWDPEGLRAAAADAAVITDDYPSMVSTRDRL